MEWKIFFTTFGMLFLAELGDKTQLAVISLASVGKHPIAVFLGAVSALTLATLIGVLAGELLGRWIPKVLMHKSAGIVLIVAGLFLLFQRTSS